MPAYRYRYRNQYMSEGELIFNSRNNRLAIKKLEEINQALEKEDVIVTLPCSLESGNMKQYRYTNPYTGIASMWQNYKI